MNNELSAKFHSEEEIISQDWLVLDLVVVPLPSLCCQFHFSFVRCHNVNIIDFYSLHFHQKYGN